MFKTKNQPNPAEVVRNKLSDDQSIVPFPQVVGRLVSALKDPQVNSSTLSQIIEEDAALTLRLLRMANSPMFGISNVIETVERAVTMIGKRPLKNVALTFAASSLFTQDSTTKTHKESLWSHSLGCAMVGRGLAGHVDSLSPDDAFLAGIFHDIGKLFFFDAVPETYIDLVGTKHGEALTSNERELFDMTHEDVGTHLVKSWQLSEKLMIAVGFHHQPENAIAHRELASLVGCADALARKNGIGSEPDLSIELCPETLAFLGLNDELIESVTEDAIEKFQDNQVAATSG